jgi:cell division protein FtsW (lipid II flippase)
MLGWQSLIILGGTLKIIPLTGITLPFVSYGGSSMLISCVTIGLLIRASCTRTAVPGARAAKTQIRLDSAETPRIAS